MDAEKYLKIADYITENPIAIIGTLDEDNTPYGAVVYVCTDDHRQIIYFITKNATRKYKNLNARPSVSVTIANPWNNSTMQAKGRASTVRDAKTVDMIAKKITRIYSSAPEWLPPIAKLRAGDYVMVGIELAEARLAHYQGKKIGEPGIFIQA